jgi:hypothetical protein
VYDLGQSENRSRSSESTSTCNLTYWFKESYQLITVFSAGSLPIIASVFVLHAGQAISFQRQTALQAGQVVGLRCANPTYGYG